MGVANYLAYSLTMPLALPFSFKSPHTFKGGRKGEKSSISLVSATKRNLDQSDVLIHTDGMELHLHESGSSETSQHIRDLITSRVSLDAGMTAMYGGDEFNSVQAES